MEPTFTFFKTTMAESRAADFHLGCLDGSVFIDFNYTTNNRINLCRISFDGYGCCNIGNNSIPLDDQTSKAFVLEMANDYFDQEKLANIVLEIIRRNKDNIWTDALEEYNLIQKK